MQTEIKKHLIKEYQEMIQFYTNHVDRVAQCLYDSKKEVSVLQVLHEESLISLRNIEQKLRNLIDED